MTFQPVLVRWRDITVSTGWIEQDALDSFVMDAEEAIVTQVGFLYEEDEEQIVLLNSFFHGKDLLGDVTKIPKGCVIQVVKMNY